MTAPETDIDIETLRDRALKSLTTARDRTTLLTSCVEGPDLTAQHSPLMSPLVWDLAHIGNQEELWLLRNVGGYNVLVASFGPCYAIVDAPASFSVDPPLPAPGPPKNLSKDVLTRAAEAVPGKKLCWVVPTHHHGDHIGGAAALVRSSPDAKLVVAPGTRSLGERLAGPGRVVEVAGEGPLTLGEGDERMDIHRVTGALHADEMLFVYFPARRISFEGDLSDYVLASKRLLQVIDAHDFVLDRMYAVHTSTSYDLPELEGDEPYN